MFYLVDNLNIDHFDTNCNISIKSVSSEHVVNQIIYNIQSVFAVHNSSTAEFLSKLLNRQVVYNSYYIRPRPGDVIYYCKCLSDGMMFWKKVIVESSLEEQKT